MTKIFREDKIPKPRSWYYSGITNMTGEYINNDLMFLGKDGMLPPGAETTSLSLTKGGKLQVLANFHSMLYVENTTFKFPNYNNIGVSHKYPLKIIVREMNIACKKMNKKLAFLAWNADYYLLAIGSLGRFPDRHSGIISVMNNILSGLFNSNFYQQVAIQKSLYFTFKELTNSLEEEKESKDNMVFRV